MPGLGAYIESFLAAAGKRATAASEFDLIAAAVDGLIDREAAKLDAGELGFDWDVFSGADAFVETADMVALAHELKSDPDLTSAITTHVEAGRVRAAYAENAALLVRVVQALGRPS